LDGAPRARPGAPVLAALGSRRIHPLICVIALLSGGDVAKQLIVRNVDDGIVRALKRRASRHGRSAESEHREILRDALRGELERSSFKLALATMPDVGRDEDFTFDRDLPRDIS
jgi:antitoxin FitA